MNARDAFVINNVKNRKICIKIDEDELFYMTEIIDNGGGIDLSLLDKYFIPISQQRQLDRSWIIYDENYFGKYERKC